MNKAAYQVMAYQLLMRMAHEFRVNLESICGTYVLGGLQVTILSSGQEVMIEPRMLPIGERILPTGWQTELESSDFVEYASTETGIEAVVRHLYQGATKEFLHDARLINQFNSLVDGAVPAVAEMYKKLGVEASKKKIRGLARKIIAEKYPKPEDE